MNAVQDAGDDLAELVLLGLVGRVAVRVELVLVEQVAQPAGLPARVDRPPELLADRAEVGRLLDRAVGLVEDGLAQLPLRNAMSIAVRSAMPSWRASDCGSSASYRSGSMPSIRAWAVSWATMSRDRLVWIELAPARNEKNWRLCERRS